MDGLTIFEITILIINFIIFIMAVYKIRKKTSIKKVLITSIFLLIVFSPSICKFDFLTILIIRFLMKIPIYAVLTETEMR